METEATTWSEFPNKGKATANKYQVQKIEINSKEQKYENHSQGSKYKSLRKVVCHRSLWLTLKS